MRRGGAEDHGRNGRGVTNGTVIDVETRVEEFEFGSFALGGIGREHSRPATRAGDSMEINIVKHPGLVFVCKIHLKRSEKLPLTSSQLGFA